ncbi:MAG: hypothetical protein J7L69_04475 [Desulfobulbaceae bacterium]|nr:hypothetical protein [Desulfobulbaceae bacterium]
MIEKYDKKECYCRMLGHFLPFRYCRTMQNGLPCGKILDCWFRILPIQTFIEENYSQEEREMIFEPPKPKMVSLAEMIERSKQQPGKK